MQTDIPIVVSTLAKAPAGVFLATTDFEGRIAGFRVDRPDGCLILNIDPGERFCSIVRVEDSEREPAVQYPTAFIEAPVIPTKIILDPTGDAPGNLRLIGDAVELIFRGPRAGSPNRYFDVKTGTIAERATGNDIAYLSSWKIVIPIEGRDSEVLYSRDGAAGDRLLTVI